MTESTPSGDQGYSFGAALLLFGGFLLLFSRNIERRGAMAEHDPGPAAFPVAIACCLIAGGVYELARAMRARRLAQPPLCPAPSAPKGSKRQLLDALVLLVALAAYISALPWAGFNLSTFIFALASMAWLGTRWWLGLLMSALLVVLTQVLFARAFSVPLPAGQWGLPL
jgi:hypothetical protein